MLKLVKLERFAKRKPHQLSGGQRQRVALARAVAKRPKVLLLDEPLGALDKKLREETQFELMDLQMKLGLTFVVVTHDQEEAMTMSDRICLMNAGQIAQLGTPADLYFRPRSLFVADFIGESNLLPARVDAVAAETVEVRLGDTAVQAARNGAAVAPGQAVKLMLRPQNLTVGAAGRLAARITDIMVSGSLTKLYMEAADLPPLVAAYPTSARAAAHAVGDTVHLDWNAADAVIIADERPS
jgi:putative spermidine/putrescine transport system ATP-binding protein